VLASRKRFRHLALACFTLVITCLAASRRAEAGPRIKFDEPTYDFDKMYQEESLTHEYTLRNVGDATLKIEKVLSTCGCAAALPAEREIPPDGKGSIKVTFRSGRMRDKVTKHIYVESNDPVEPRVTLTLKGTIRVEAETIPSGMYLGNLRVGMSIERELLIRPVEAKDLRILEVRSTHQSVRVSSPESLTDNQGGYRIKVSIGPLSKPERLTAYVIVRTNLEHSKELRVFIYARVQNQAPVQPQ